MMMARYWVNQPSTTQPHHKQHGMNVIAPENLEGRTCVVYFTRGPVVSQIMNTNVLARRTSVDEWNK